ncbi:threonine-phosphate decarboxylase CobD [Methylobacterium sp. NEAU K]|uniref:threonine-phosphate decarboxylase CobD n=1 Tax=Methylobacterium sp. NEAU K TaxID=3064946 RepID=UPI002735B399|nr:threonine-phosphate decarboxylase CobD [Methylobacterium sp. NEAU K]MDP4005790.1 threonine-phosphate decarboxylase CobD [Methylobacterium sp. NEAU K]
MDHLFWNPAPEPGAIPHGGDLGELRKAFPDAPEPWLDLSTGINPVPYPAPPVEASAWTRLPGAAEVRALRDAAAEAYRAPDAAHVVPAPGTQILIELLPRLVAPTRVAVVGPTYAEHAAAWARAGHAVAEVGGIQAIGDAPVAVLVDPNNPDGRTHPLDERLALAAALRARGGLLVADEAFADLEPGASLCPHVPHPNAGPALVVLRSFGKTYGLAGLRLGFAVADPGTADRIATALGPWAVSGPALAIGRAALADAAWRAQAARAREADAGRLDRLIARGGGRIVGGTRLFRTADFADGPGLYRRLAEAGIAVRRFAERPERLRFGLPAGKAAWCRLARVLKPEGFRLQGGG